MYIMAYDTIIYEATVCCVALAGKEKHELQGRLFLHCPSSRAAYRLQDPRTITPSPPTKSFPTKSP